MPSLYLLVPTPVLPLFLSLACSLQLWVCFFFVIFTSLIDSTYNWYQTVFVFLCLTYSLNILPSKSIHIAESGTILSFLGLSSIPLCIYMYVYVYYISFIHSSVDGHLSCFHFLSIVNNATATNIGMHVSFQIHVFGFFRYIPRSGITRSYRSSIFTTIFKNWKKKMYVFKVLMCLAAAASPKSCPTLCDPTDGSPSGSPIPGILQARTLEWVAISFSNAGKWKVKVNSLSHVRLLTTPWTAAYQAPLSMGFSRQEYWSGVPSPSHMSYQPLYAETIYSSTCSMWTGFFLYLLLHWTSSFFKLLPTVCKNQ